MFEYTYIRSHANGKYDIPNKDRVDGDGNQIRLAREIATALPGKSLKVICNGTSCIVSFMVELTAGEETTLDSVVADHKANA